MNTTTKKLMQSFIIVPLLATSISMESFSASIDQAVSKATTENTIVLSDAEVALAKERQIKAAKIDAYYAKYGLPLSGYGMDMVLAAEKNNLDWRLLPAIAMRESTGCKFIIQSKKNCFGWGTAKFDSFEHGIYTVGSHLGGTMPTTARYYANKDIKGKLKSYNSVIPAYTAEIFSIMKKIEQMPV